MAPYIKALLHIYVLVCVVQCCSGDTVNVFLISTYTDGTPPESAKWFCQWLAEAVDDFRVHKSLLSKLNFTVFALGNSLYKEHYNSVGKNLFDWLNRLSGTPVYPLGLGDQNVAESVNGGTELAVIYVDTYYLWSSSRCGGGLQGVEGWFYYGGLSCSTRGETTHWCHQCHWQS